jgi:hypothetical protein
VATTLVRDYPGLAATAPDPHSVAAELIQLGGVALFLDDLDDMPFAARGKALTRIDQEATQLRVVLSRRLGRVS